MSGRTERGAKGQCTIRLSHRTRFILATPSFHRLAIVRSGSGRGALPLNQMYWRSTAAPAGVLASSMGGIPATGRIEAGAWGFITQRRYRNATGPAPPPPTLIRFMTRVPARAVTAIMRETGRAWRKGGGEKCGKAGKQRDGRVATANLSTFRWPLHLRHPRASGAKRNATEDPCRGKDSNAAEAQNKARAANRRLCPRCSGMDPWLAPFASLGLGQG
jgi:hypothetical protein